MDSLTHACVGFATCGLIWGRAGGLRAAVAGGLVALLPDLDVVLLPFLHGAEHFAFHRGPSHSLFVAAPDMEEKTPKGEK